MKKSTIILCVKENIESYGSLFGGTVGCVLCNEAKKRKALFWNSCDACSLWDYFPKPKYEGFESPCGKIKYKGERLCVLDMRLEGNKPALRAVLNGLVNLASKGRK